jgi:hypothetical protein
MEVLGLLRGDLAFAKQINQPCQGTMLTNFITQVQVLFKKLECTCTEGHPQAKVVNGNVLLEFRISLSASALVPNFLLASTTVSFWELLG